MAESASNSSQRKVLFVCLGNICRSPCAEGVFKSLVKGKKLQDKFVIDSCGLGGGSDDWYKRGGFSYHEGEAADQRMAMAADKRGISVVSVSRPLKPSDIEEFDDLVIMDSSNRERLEEAAEHWGKLDSAKKKVKLMTSFCRKHKADFVPDPYYGGAKGFDVVLDLLEDACDGLLEDLSSKD